MDYRLRGEHYTAPDRGSPNGAWYPFSFSFKAESDSDASRLFKEYLTEKYPGCDIVKDFRRLELIRFEEIDLSRVLA